jgi:predicted DsbA family dithiol-disulfide isomerase
MTRSEPRFYFDFTDPLSYLADLGLRALEAEGASHVHRVGFELRPPPLPLTLRSDPIWTARWATAREATRPGDLGAPLSPPDLVPWTRKAHELHALAVAAGAGTAVRIGIFDAYFGGRDIGRIDELVRIADASGLPATETKAALDVDKHEADVLEARRRANALGVVDTPALVVSGTVAQGFHNLTDLSTLLGGPPGGRR